MVFISISFLKAERNIAPELLLCGGDSCERIAEALVRWSRAPSRNPARAKPRISEQQEKGGVMPLSRRTLWIGATLAIVAAVIVVLAVFAGGGAGGTGY
jgi:hypothetical protein